MSTKDKLKYKGYLGTIQFSENDNCFYGKVLGMQRACITYEGENASELLDDFKGAIDMYLEHCQRKEIKPEEPYNDLLNIHLPSDTHIKAVMYAENHGTSIDAFVGDLIEKHFEPAI